MRRPFSVFNEVRWSERSRLAHSKANARGGLGSCSVAMALHHTLSVLWLELRIQFSVEDGSTMTSTILYLLCVLIGGVSGLRSLTGIAVVTIVAQRGWPHLGWLHLGGTGLGFLGRPVATYIFVVLAIGELIADKLSFTPPRVQAGPLAVRFLLGAVCSSALAVAAGMSWVFPAAVGGVSAIVGAYAGYWLRRGITSRGVKDLPIALLEDGTAILLALFAVSRF
jgi:uncharacterized membrane protein